MILIVGLGNPDKKYQNTRHNAGFLVVDELADGNWKFSKKFKSEICQTIIEDQEVMLVKPMTYMNKSGEAVRQFVGFLSLATDNVWVIYDDIDLELGTVRVRTSGSAGGHRGVMSVANFLGTDKFSRFRVGIKTDLASYMPSEDFVLKTFTAEEKPVLNEAIEKTIDLIKKSLRDGIEHTSA